MLEALEQPATPDSAVGDTTTVDSADLPDSNLEGTDGELGDQQTPEEIEEELEGIKLRGSKESLEKLKSERLMQADYTRKTQEVAETRKSLEADRAQFQESAKSHQQYIREVAQVVAIDDRLAQFSQVNWQALTDQDPVQALKLHTEFTQLQARRGQLANALTQKQQVQQQEQQRTHAKQLMEARQVLEREIKGWSPDLAGKLMEYGSTQGFSAQELNNVTQPALVKVLHKAHLYDQLQKQRQAKPTATPAPPVTRVSGAAASSTKPLSEVSDAEFIRRRREYISKHR
jgi:hypothetical protein